MRYKDMKAFLGLLGVLFEEDPECPEEVCRDVERAMNAYAEIAVMLNMSHIGNNRLLVAGSRSITDIDISKYIPKDVDAIISGGAKGIDTLAEEYADKHKISKVIIRPSYSVSKKAAPILRNQSMVILCNRVLAIWDGKSRGTKYTIDYAKKLDKDVTVININEKQS